MTHQNLPRTTLNIKNTHNLELSDGTFLMMMMMSLFDLLVYVYVHVHVHVHVRGLLAD